MSLDLNVYNVKGLLSTYESASGSSLIDVTNAKGRLRSGMAWSTLAVSDREVDASRREHFQKQLGSSWRPCFLGTTTTGILLCTNVVKYLTRSINQDEVVPIDIGEVDELVADIENRKAPGAEGVRTQVVKRVFSRKPKLVVELYNVCLSRGYFPGKWKLSELIYKGPIMCRIGNSVSLRVSCPLMPLYVYAGTLEQWVASTLRPRQWI